MGYYRKADAEDPGMYVSGAATVLSAYPEDVVREVTDPLRGLPATVQWLPSLAEIKAACDALMKPRYEAERRRLDAEEQRRLLGPPPVTPEQRARAVAHWTDRVRPEMHVSDKAPKTEVNERAEAAAKLKALSGLSDEDFSKAMARAKDAKPRKDTWQGLDAATDAAGFAPMRQAAE
jgi:hypothetical protein